MVFAGLRPVGLGHDHAQEIVRLRILGGDAHTIAGVDFSVGNGTFGEQRQGQLVRRPQCIGVELHEAPQQRFGGQTRGRCCCRSATRSRVPRAAPAPIPIPRGTAARPRRPCPRAVRRPPARPPAAAAPPPPAPAIPPGRARNTARPAARCRTRTGIDPRASMFRHDTPNDDQITRKDRRQRRARIAQNLCSCRHHRARRGGPRLSSTAILTRGWPGASRSPARPLERETRPVSKPAQMALQWSPT